MSLVTFTVDGVAGTVRATMPDGSEPTLGDADALEQGRAAADGIMKEFRRSLTLHPTKEQVDEALRYLDHEAGKLGRMLTGGNGGRLASLQAQLRTAWPTWETGSEVPYVEVRGRHEDFPFELIPAFDGRTLPKGTLNPVQAACVMRRFLGFGAAVRRVGSEEVTPAEPLRRHRSRLPIQFLRYLMVGAEQEKEYFDDCGGALDVDGPWPPDDLDEQAILDGVLRALHDPWVRLDGTRREDIPFQIQHFACHCDTGVSKSEQYAMLLGRKPGFKITLGEIDNGLYRHAADHGAFDDPRPLVFLNACASSRIDARRFGSFPRIFLANNFRAFVGTHADVPDEVAAVFATLAYDELLAGRRLGEALVHARRKLMTKHGNPLGALYVLYGDAMLKIDDDEGSRDERDRAAERA